MKQLNGLNKLIQDIAAKHPEADNATVVNLVADETSSRELRDYYRMALLPVVTAMFGARRRDAFLPTDSPNVNVGDSAKVEQRRQFDWNRLLEQRVGVQGGDKAIGDCDLEDLQYAATYRRNLAKGNLAQAENFDRLANLLEKHRVSTVRELPRQDDWAL
jgi:hypothetical protein